MHHNQGNDRLVCGMIKGGSKWVVMDPEWPAHEEAFGRAQGKSLSSPPEFQAPMSNHAKRATFVALFLSVFAFNSPAAEASDTHTLPSGGDVPAEDAHPRAA